MLVHSSGVKNLRTSHHEQSCTESAIRLYFALRRGATQQAPQGDPSSAVLSTWSRLGTTPGNSVALLPP